MTKLAFLNTTIATANDATFKLQTLTLAEAKRKAQSAGATQSHVGHQATADTMTKVLGVEIPMDRTPLAQEVGQEALALKLNIRLEEGQVLSEEELEEVGYQFVLMTRTA
jgi:hypothetical protein